MLDGNTLGFTGIRFDIDSSNQIKPSNTTLPAKIRQGTWGEGSTDIGVGFLSVFFPLFDTDRQTLLQQYYTPTTLFSLSVDTVTPHEPTHHRRGAFSGSNQPQTSNLSGYIPQSRNLQRTTTPAARATRLHQGRDQISQAFRNLPRTKHPIEDASAFVADGFQVQIGTIGGIMVSVHGEFYEMADRGEIRRSFDRTFLLGPPASTNPGSQCVVVSDLLVLRPYSGREAWIPEDNAVDAQGLLQEMRRRTGLNDHFSGLLLQECNGDIEAGVRRFEEAKVALFDKLSDISL
jgi:nuclear RNA export factor